MQNYKGFVRQSGKAEVDKFVQNASTMHQIAQLYKTSGSVTPTTAGPTYKGREEGEGMRGKVPHL